MAIVAVITPRPMQRHEAVEQLKELHVGYVKLRDAVDRKRRVTGTAKAQTKFWYQQKMDAVAFAIEALGGKLEDENAS